MTIDASVRNCFECTHLQGTPLHATPLLPAGSLVFYQCTKGKFGPTETDKLLDLEGLDNTHAGQALECTRYTPEPWVR